MVGVFLITGCSSKSKDIVNNGNVMTCTRSVNKNGMKTSLNYKVYYEGDDVTRIKSEESIQMENNKSLKGYKEQIEKVYEPYKNVKFYNYNIAIRGNKLISKVDINYSKIDTNKLIEIDKANSQIITDGKIKVSSVKSLYEKLGATCK